MKKLLFTAALFPVAALVQWQADLESGQGDAFGLVLFFFAFFAYVHIRDAAKESTAKAWQAGATCLAVVIAAWYFHPVRVILMLVFLVSFFHYAWTSLRGPKR